MYLQLYSQKNQAKPSLMHPLVPVILTNGRSRQKWAHTRASNCHERTFAPEMDVRARNGKCHERTFATEMPEIGQKLDLSTRSR